MNMGLVLIDLHDFAGASRALATAVEHSTKDDQRFDAINAMGVAARGEGDVDRAVELYRSATRVKPSSPEPYCNGALALIQRRNTQCDIDRSRQWLLQCSTRIDHTRDASRYDRLVREVTMLTRSLDSHPALDAVAAMNSVPSSQPTVLTARVEAAPCPSDFE